MYERTSKVRAKLFWNTDTEIPTGESGRRGRGPRQRPGGRGLQVGDCALECAVLELLRCHADHDEAE